MELREALDIVLSLAQDSALDPACQDADFQMEAERQEQAIEQVHKLLSLLSEKSG